MFECWPEMWGGGYPAYRTTLRKFLWFRTVTGGNAPEFKTVTGKIVSFVTKRIAPLKIEADLEPIQSGTGDPSPENVRPISGHTGCDIYDDPKYGGTINFNQLAKLDATYWNTTRSDISFTGQSLKLEATSNATNATKYAYFYITAGHKYAVLGINNATTNTAFHFGVYRSMSSNTYDDRVAVPSTDAGERIDHILTSNTAAAFGIALPTSAKAEDGKFAQIDNLCVCDLTEMFGAGNEPETIEAFKALFYKDYYAYNSGTETCVSAVNGDPYTKVTLTFGSTVYGGKLTVNEDGSGTVKDRPYYASYNGETLVGPWVSSMDAYAPGITPTTGAQVVDMGGTETAISLTPGQVNALLGNNTVWVDDSDNISVTYQSN